jgi:hypothetical protein
LIKLEGDLFGKEGRKLMEVVVWFLVKRLQSLSPSGVLGSLTCSLRAGLYKQSGCGSKKTDPNRPWQGLTIPVQQQVKDLFAKSVISIIGNGNNTLFWTDNWVHGAAVRDIAPEVAAKVGKRVLYSTTVAQALADFQWVNDIRAPLSLLSIQQCLLIWDSLGEVHLSQEPDQHRWRHNAQEYFLQNLVIKACFLVQLPLNHGNGFGKPGLLLNENSFFGWL